MTRYLLATWEGGGNLAPELGVAKKLIARGHSVHVLADPSCEKAARAAGCGFSPWVTAPHKHSLAPEEDFLHDWTFGNNLFKLFEHALEVLVCGPAEKFIADTFAVLDKHPADVVLADFIMLGVQIAAEARGLPCGVLIPHISMRPQKGVPPFGPGFLPAKGPFGRMRDVFVGSFAKRMWKKGLPTFNRARASVGLQPIDDIWTQYEKATREFVLTSPSFDFLGPTPLANQRYLGPMLEDPVFVVGATWTSPWPASNTDPIVLVGLSSTYQQQQQVISNVVAALAKLPVRALVTLGPALAPDAVTSPADNVVIVPTAPHSQILPHAALAITHCGHGTTMRALTSGVPLVCVPMGRDQNDVAARVFARGAGVRIKPTASAAAIRRAVETVLREPRFREGARALRDTMAAEARVADPIALVEELDPEHGRKSEVNRAS